MKFGFFSEKAATGHGSCFWKDSNGNDVEITAVFDTFFNGVNGYGWEDKTYVGPVYTFSRYGRPRPYKI